MTPEQELAALLARLFAGGALGFGEKARVMALVSKVQPWPVFLLTVGHVVRAKPGALAALRQVLDAAEGKPLPTAEDQAAASAKPVQPSRFW